MRAALSSTNGCQTLTSSNFNTHTLMLQLGAILVTVPEWKNTHILGVILFVEREMDRVTEVDCMTKLLQILRIEATLVVVSLDQFRVYNTIVKNDSISFDYIQSKLQDNQ